MKVKQSAILGALGAGAAIKTQEAGFLPGMVVPAFVGSPGGAFTGTAVIETSEDGVTFATGGGATAVTGAGLNVQNITLKQFIRLNVTAFTSGNIQATFVSDVG